MAIPTALTEQRRWVLWRGAKVPHQPDGRFAKSTDPATWATYAAAVAAAPRFDGLGFVLGGGFVGVDLDKCLDGNGVCAQWAAQIVARLDSYTEVSPSGTGLHIFLLGVLPGPSRKTAGIEVYGGDRYFTVTGSHWPGTSPTVEKRQMALADWYRQTFPLEPPVQQPAPPAELDATDAQLLAAAFASRTGPDILRLFNEPGAPGNSEGDAALAGKLSFYSGGDVARLERLMRHSARWREKWDRAYGDGETWLARECRRAIGRHTGEWYAPRRRTQTEGGVRHVAA